MGITVPTYGTPKAAVQAAPDTTISPRMARIEPDAFGAGLGQGISQVSQAAAGIYADVQNKADNAQLNGAQAQWQAAQNKRQVDFLNLQGEQALGQQADFQTQAAKDAEDIRKGLNPRVQNHWDLWAPHAVNQFNAAIDSHASAQVPKIAAEKNSAAVQGTLDNIGLNYSDPAQVKAGLNQLAQTAEAYGHAQGEPIEVTAQKLRDLKAQAHASVVSGYLSVDQDVAAKAYLDQNRGDMNPAQVNQFTKALDISSTRGQAQDLVDSIMHVGDTLGESNDLQKMSDRVAADTEGNPKLRDEAQQRLEHAFAIRKQTHAEQQNGLFEGAVDAASKDPTKGIDAVPAQTLAAMDPTVREHLRAALAKQIDPVQSRMAVASFTLALADPNLKQKILDAGPPVGGGNTTIEDQKTIIDLWTKAKTGEDDPKAKRDLQTLQDKMQSVAGVLQSAGYSMKKDPDSGYDPKTAAMLDYVDRDGEAMQAARKDKAPLTPDDWRVVAGKALAQQTIKGTGFLGGDQSTTTADMYAEQIKAIPPDVKAGLEAAFNAKNRRLPTADELLRSWGAYQQKTPTPAPDPNALDKKDVFGLPSKRSGVTGFLHDLWDLSS